VFVWVGGGGAPPGERMGAWDEVVGGLVVQANS